MVNLRVRSIELVQQTKFLDIVNLSNVINEKSCIKDFAFIEHNKDVKEDGAPVEPHVHLMLRFNEVQDTKYIAKWFNVPENCLCKIKGKFADALCYLTHENAPNKHRYDEAEVVSNFDFKKEKEKKSSNLRKEEIINKIVSGEIREYNYYEYITISEYDKYRKSIDNAFKYRIDKIKGVARQMECVFITGDSGTGKTSYAKKIAEEKGYSVFISSGSNDPLDDYKGQDCIILDDLRPSCMGLSDLLKMLDNHTASTVKSRYKNKVLECKMIIITTTLDIDKFFNNVFSEEKETVVQLKRRCNVMLKFDMDYVHNYLWQGKIRNYEYMGKIPNPITLEMNVDNMTTEQKLDKLAEILGLSKDLVETLRDNCLEEVKDNEQIEW